MTKFHTQPNENNYDQHSCGIKKNENHDVGFFGPNSHIWLNHQYFIRGIGYPVAVIIIVIHPIVFEIISSYIKTPRALRERLFITRKYSFDLIFGDKQMAMQASKALQNAHEKIKHVVNNVAHSPLEPDLMLWVFGAIYYTSKRMNELLLLNIPFNEGTYQEYRILAQLYGISELHLPDKKELFEQYWNNRLCELLKTTEETKAYIHSKLQLSIVDIFFSSSFPSGLRFIFKPIDHLIRIFCIYCIPIPIAKAFDLRLSNIQRTGMTYFLKCIRWIHAILPRRLKIEKKVREIWKQYGM